VSLGENVNTVAANQWAALTPDRREPVFSQLIIVITMQFGFPEAELMRCKMLFIRNSVSISSVLLIAIIKLSAPVLMCVFFLQHTLEKHMINRTS